MYIFFCVTTTYTEKKGKECFALTATVWVIPLSIEAE